MALSLSTATIPASGAYAELIFDSQSGAPLAIDEGITGITFKKNGVTLPYIISSYAGGHDTASTDLKFFFDTPPIYSTDVLTVTIDSSNLTNSTFGQTVDDVTDFPITNGSLLESSSGWYYADQTAVEDALSAAGLSIISNMENDSTDTNTSRTQRAGLIADARMNKRLGRIGFTIPFDLSDDDDALILQQISVAFVITLLCRWRVLQLIDAAGQPRSVIDKMADGQEKWAEAQLDDIAWGRIDLTATRSVTGPQDNAAALDIRGLPMYPQTPPGGLPGYYPPSGDVLAGF